MRYRLYSSLVAAALLVAAPAAAQVPTPEQYFGFKIGADGELAKYPKILVPEMNLGQLSKLLRAEYLVDAKGYSKTDGLPLFAEELDEVFTEWLTSRVRPVE